MEEEAGGGDAPVTKSIHPSTIKTAQEEMGRLDILVCGECHSVFHFIKEFQDHRSKEGVCSKTSNFRENSNNEQKAQVWAFLLWKDTQIHQESPDKDSNSWKLYQKWCNMEPYVRDGWITAGKTIQTFTKISNAKMQDAPLQQGSIISEGGKTVVVRKIIRNGQPESSDKKEMRTDFKIKSEYVDHEKKVKLRPANLHKNKLNQTDDNNDASSGEEYEVEKILAKRFNPKKKVYEYLLKWDGYEHEHNSWEEVSLVSMTCKQLIDEFEKNLAKQKEIKAQQVAKTGGVLKSKDGKAGSSSSSQAGRPMRSSKSKAMDQVKQWCGSMNDEEQETIIGKRKINFSDSESDEDGIVAIKRSKVDTSGDDDWTADSEEDKGMVGRSDVIQRAFSRANAQPNGGNRSSSITGSDNTNSIQQITNKNVFKPNTQPTSNVYIVHKKEGVIKLDSSPTNKISVKGPNTSTIMVQNRDGNIIRKQIVGSHGNSITPVKVVSKPDGTQVVTQISKVAPKNSTLKSGAVMAQNKLMKIQPKPDPNQSQQIHFVTAMPSQLPAQRLSANAVRSPGQRTPQVTRPQTSIMRQSTPMTSSFVGTKTPVKTSVQRQIVPQRRTTPTTILQVSTSPATVNTNARPKITILNQQGKVIQKTVVGTNPTRSLPKTIPVPKVQNPVAVAKQKMLAARRKVAEQAGIIPKPAGARNVGAAGAKSAVRVKASNASTTAIKPKESKLAPTDGLHMEFHEIGSEESSGEEPTFQSSISAVTAPATTQPPEPESPPRLTLCPLTGRIIGPDGQPIEQPDPEPEPSAPATPMAIVQVSTGGATINVDGTITTAGGGETAELVIPNLDGLADSTGGIVRVEMSPGGTTGTIVQTSESMSISMPNVVVPGPDLPCLDDSNVEEQATSSDIVVSAAPEVPADTTATSSSTSELIVPGAVTTTTMTSAPVQTSTAEVTTTESILTETAENEILPTMPKDEVASSSEAMSVKMDENNGIVTITGEDGVLYQVAGHAEDGQTLLVTRADGGDGEQQCVYVTTSDAQPTEEGAVLTLDQAVAQLMPDQATQQFYVKEATEGTTEGVEGASAENQQMVMSIMDDSNTIVAGVQEDGDNQAQVVAQVVQADEPSPGGTRRVVLLLPDGNLMMTEVDEEQYAALELDK